MIPVDGVSRVLSTTGTDGIKGTDVLDTSQLELTQCLSITPLASSPDQTVRVSHVT